MENFNSDDNMNSDKRRLRLLGITYNQIQSGLYALILEEMDGNRRIPIVIGYPEAQAIECRLQEVKTPRPLSHDLMASIIGAFGGNVVEIVIRRLPTGVFAADIVLEDADGIRFTVDSRSSDAVALAIRVDAPIFTTAEVLDDAGFVPDNSTEPKNPVGQKLRYVVKGPSASGDESDTPLALMSDEKLREELEHAIEKENYERAQEIKKILDSRE